MLHIYSSFISKSWDAVFVTLSLDVGNIQALLQAQNNATKLEVKGIAESRKEENRFSTAATNWTIAHTAKHSAHERTF